MQNAIERNGVMIARSPGGIGVMLNGVRCTVKVEVDYHGRRLKTETLSPFVNPSWRDYVKGVDMLACAIRVLDDAGSVLAELLPPDDILPYMLLQGEQRHITEGYVSVPPSLTITDEVGAVWTLGYKTAPRELSPEGEYAFDVLRDGIDMGEIASRIEKRGRVRIFTAGGWKRWTGSTFI